jgi:hypothetical protein
VNRHAPYVLTACQARSHFSDRLRGLLHRSQPSDGDQPIYGYPRYHFTNVSTDIIGLFTEALDRLNIFWKVHATERGKPYKDTYVVSVSTRDAVARLDEFVGPKY